MSSAVTVTPTSTNKSERISTVKLIDSTVQISYRGLEIFEFDRSEVICVHAKKRLTDITPSGRTRWCNITIVFRLGHTIELSNVSERFGILVRKAVRRPPT